jgi:hypothetical protein
MKADASGVVTVTVLGGGYRALLESLTVITRRANSAKELRSRTPARLYVYETILERLPQDLQDMAAELGPCIQEEHTMVGQRHLARHGHMAPADQPDVRGGVLGGAEGASRDPRRAGAGATGDAVDTRGLDGFGQGHHRQDGGAPPRGSV